MFKVYVVVAILANALVIHGQRDGKTYFSFSKLVLIHFCSVPYHPF